MCKSTELEFQNIWKRQVGAIVSQKLMGLQESFRKMLHQRLLRQNFPGYLCKALLCLKSTLSTINFSDGLFVFELEFENLANTFSERSLSKPMLWCICIKVLVFAEPFFCESTLSILMLSIVNYLHTFVLLSMLTPSLSKAGWSSGDQNDDDATKKLLLLYYFSDLPIILIILW